MIDFDNLPTDPHEIETLINSLDKDELFLTINRARDRVVSNPDFTPSELENRVLILLTRRLRGVRENTKSKARAPKAAPKTLDSLL